MVHGEQCGSHVLWKSRMRREIVLIPNTMSILFLAAVGPKDCTTRKRFSRKNARVQLAGEN